jgi:hypothetical protein
MANTQLHRGTIRLGRRNRDELVARVEGVLPGETATARAAYASPKGERKGLRALRPFLGAGVRPAAPNAAERGSGYGLDHVHHDPSPIRRQSQRLHHHPQLPDGVGAHTRGYEAYSPKYLELDFSHLAA